MAQSFKTVDVLRLEVEDDPTGLVNLVQNPNGEFGGWGWITPLTSSTMRGVNDNPSNLMYERTTAGASYFTTEDLPVTAGEYVAAYWLLAFSLVYIRVSFEFYNAAGASLGFSTMTGYYTGTTTGTKSPTVAPSGSAKVRLRFDVYQNTSAADPTGSHAVLLQDVTVVKAATPAAFGTTRYNLIRNPSFEAGTGAWMVVSGDPAPPTIGRTNTVAQAGSFTGRLTTNSVTPAPSTRCRTESIAVTAGQTYVGSAYLRSAAVVRRGRVLLSFYNGSGTQIGGSLAGDIATLSTSGWTRVSVTGVAPVGAATAAMLVEFSSSGPNMGLSEVQYFDAAMLEQATALDTYFDGWTPDAGGWDYSWTGLEDASISAAFDSDLSFIEPVQYLNVLGPTHDVKIVRDELDVGLLTATILDASLDPAKADLLRPGRRVRALALDPDTSAWTPLFLGKAQNAKVAYDYKTANLPDAKRARITLTATDNVSVVASVPREEGVATIPDLPHLLEGAGVPWNVNGSGNQVPTATVVARNANASLLDQIAITRDSALGYAWVDRRGVVTAYDAAKMSTTSVATFDEADYTDLAIDYDTERCINTVSLKLIRFNLATGETVEVPYGPYVDQESVDQWGPRSAEFTIQGITESEPALTAYANSILAANATPTIRVNAVTLAVLDAGEVTYALRDLYDLITVQNAAAELDQAMRIVGIEHTITADNRGGKWLVSYSFGADGGVAPPQQTPSPAPAGVASGWVPLPFTNGWSNVGGGQQICQLERVGNKVYARGLAAVGGSAGIALIPEDYRPPATLVLGARAYTGAPTPTEVSARVDITAAGVLSIVTPALGTSAWVSLSGLWWAVD